MTTAMNSQYCNVTNPTWHLEPQLQSCLHQDYSWRMYDDVPNYDHDSESMKERPSQAHLAPKMVV